MMLRRSACGAASKDVRGPSARRGSACATCSPRRHGGGRGLLPLDQIHHDARVHAEEISRRPGGCGGEGVASMTREEDGGGGGGGDEDHKRLASAGEIDGCRSSGVLMPSACIRWRCVVTSKCRCAPFLEPSRLPAPSPRVEEQRRSAAAARGGPREGPRWPRMDRHRRVYVAFVVAYSVAVHGGASRSLVVVLPGLVCRLSARRLSPLSAVSASPTSRLRSI